MLGLLHTGELGSLGLHLFVTHFPFINIYLIIDLPNYSLHARLIIHMRIRLIRLYHFVNYFWKNNLYKID